MKLLNDQKQFHKTIELFEKQKTKNIETHSTLIFTQILKACTNLRDFQRGLTISNLISSRVENDSYLTTSLIHLFMESGDVKRAQVLFNKSTKKELSIYGAMMKGYVKNKLPDKAIELFRSIKNPNEIILTILFNACSEVATEKSLNLVKKVSSAMPTSYYSNICLLTSLLDSLMKCGDVEYAQLLFDRSKKNDLGLFAAMMNGYNYLDKPFEALSLLNKMKSMDFELNVIISVSLIKALSKIGNYSMCQLILKEIPDHLLSESQVQDALIDMWGKVGRVDKSEEIFEKISHPNQISFTSMINSYGLNGMGSEAIGLYHKMPLELINPITNICVLNACSHSGLINEARSIFKSIEMKTERIYSTMIDCHSRASCFDEAQSLIDEYERCHSPVLTMYMSLLSGTRNVSRADLSQRIYDRMKILFSEMKDPLVAAATLLANVYASSGDVDKSSDIKIEMKQSNSKKRSGLSWTVVEGQYAQFRAHDRSHPRSNEIYAEIEKISRELVEHGHQYDSSWITRPLNPDETVESVLCGHSERLAIAWNFVANPNVSTIQVTKNLRVCGDCHRATKLIASIRQCEIIVRDTNRIHHFHPNGKCSCNDYF